MIPYARFYLLEYFYVLLKSVERQSGKEQIFSLFKSLKEEHRLGESKYHRITHDPEELSRTRLNRYRYTFSYVIEEAKELELVEVRNDESLFVTETGRRLGEMFEKSGSQIFNLELFKLMELKHGVFRIMIEFLYSTNRYKPGLLVFPSYSPLQLGIERSQLKTTRDITEYADVLVERFEEDLRVHLSENKSLAAQSAMIIKNLQDDKLLSYQLDGLFDPKRYNAIIKRFRDYWITFFLREVYKSEVSWSTFERWVYRGKQMGIIHATEFYPNFSGKIVYPTCVIVGSAIGNDFQPIYDYDDGKRLYLHAPAWSNSQESFIKFLVDSYFELKNQYRFRGRFISLPALSELVCYKMKISEHVFQQFLDLAYRLNLSGQLRIKISLEVDKLPEETNVIYLTREPIMVDGKYRNIISIDVTKEDRA